MTSVLVVLREELRSARQQVDALEQSEQLLAAIYEPATTPDTQPPTRPLAAAQRKKTRRSGRNPNETKIRTHIAAHGPVTRGDLLKALGGHPEAMSRRLNILLARGEVEANGKPRRYRTPSASNGPDELSLQQLAPTTPRALIGARPQQPEPGRYPVYDALVGTAGATTAELAERTRMTPIAVHEQGRELARLGLVAFHGRGAARFWLTRSPDDEADANLKEASN